MKMPFARLSTGAALALALSACASLGSAPITGDSVGTIRTGVAAARAQAQTSFADADKLALDQDVEWRLSQPAPALQESDFPVPVVAADAKAWDDAFGALDGYCAALQKLVGPETSAGAGDAIASLGQQLNAGPINAKVPGAVQAVFATFGQALIQAKDEKAATDVMRKVDPAFQQVVLGMADAIGASPTPGALQGAVKSNWTVALARISLAYGKAAGADDRRAQIQAYVTAIKGRDAQLASLSDLHGSLLALGQAHTAAANGKPADAAFWIGRISGWLDEVKQREAAAQQAKVAK